MKVNLKKTIFTGKESTNSQGQSRTRAVGKIAKRMGRGLRWGVGRNMKEILKMGRYMGLGSFGGRMGVLIKGTGKMGSKME
jgi:hypothetical protein